MRDKFCLVVRNEERRRQLTYLPLSLGLILIPIGQEEFQKVFAKLFTSLQRRFSIVYTMARGCN